ncbi:MAG: GNAT family N-acetyltransferase [Spirochaetales bacterium]|uniref:GNAT family N-acetyltransferase n=1 Tax=Candidatus Thalassospirochaeta sargassi TaxID=3119039 RepID=A0AAJ1ML71_9SPIO|nr:GNAT family N-acetyltransferase [Spirochaetales bacterium]
MRLNKSDRKAIETFLNGNPYLHLYAIGDLDKRFFPYTQWYGSRTVSIDSTTPADSAGSGLSAVICIYTGGNSPTLMALAGEEGTEAVGKLLEEVIPLQPDTIQAHLSPGLETHFEQGWLIKSKTPHYKMALTNPEALDKIDTSAAVRLGQDDIPQLLELYEKSYPGNWFEPGMLRINSYCGIRDTENIDRTGDGRLIAAAGTHVYSPGHRAAALGNITVLPELRGCGLGTVVTAALAEQLYAEGLKIGLNVKTGNEAAVAAYRKAGFSVHTIFNECIMKRTADKQIDE